MMAMEEVAVVGGTGFLGRHVCSALRDAGWSVRVLSRRTGCDARTIEPDQLRGCEAVVNLAGIKREAAGQTFQAVHVDLVARLIGSLRSAGVRRLIHVSVVVARPDPALPYHDTKWKGEELVRGSGLDWTILRPGVIYGVGDDLLAHLSLMLRVAPIFPILNDGGSPMMPVHAIDVAKGVVGALKHPQASGRTIDIVGPERLTLREVVRRVAEALGLPVWIWPTPAGLLKFPVGILEAMMTQPLSTRAQLAMLVEGLAGDPALAEVELGLKTAPFLPERLRPLLAAGGHLPKQEIRPVAGLGLMMLAPVLLTLAFRGPLDPWKGMTVAMGVLMAASLALKAVRERLAPTLRRVGLGLAAGALLYGLTRIGILVLQSVWPAWAAHARQLYAWKGGYSTTFLGMTLILIVGAEEIFWRGVVVRFCIQRFGVAFGILAGAVLYMVAHAATLNPLLLGAALGCGVFWGLLAAVTDDLTAPIVSHLVWDVLILFVTPVA
ncbi:MAG TPA: NAD-dependent epimerase/dehydratase family protein [Planctomycetota bacterium]|nr:NAD-dependent epimerase/dehydratase family protein [Planctomycetota bacterium]